MVLAEALRSVDYVWVNTNAFAMGEQAETYWGIHIFELSIRAGVKHLVYSGLGSAYKLGGYDPNFRSAISRAKQELPVSTMMGPLFQPFGPTPLSEWKSAQPTNPMAWTVIDSGPYMEGLSEIFAPRPAGNNGVAFHRPLGIATAHVTGQDIAISFTNMTGKPAKYVDTPIKM